MTFDSQKAGISELKPRITVFGIGGGGGNAVNNMINAGLQGVDFLVANTDAQALAQTKADRAIQLGVNTTRGLGAGASPDIGAASAEECLEEIINQIADSHMVFITAGMGGGTGTGAAPVVARAARDKGILTVGVVTKPFNFEGARRMKTAEQGIQELQKFVDTLIVIPNQNLFLIANEKTTFADAFSMADQVLYSGVASITDLMVKEGIINLDFSDVRSVISEMGRAMMGTGEASGEGRALAAAAAAIANPLLDETSMRGARGLLISITGGQDMTLYEVDAAATRIREEVDPEANVIFGAIHDEALEGSLRVSVLATGIDRPHLDFDKHNLDIDHNLEGDPHFEPTPLDSSDTSDVKASVSAQQEGQLLTHLEIEAEENEFFEAGVGVGQRLLQSEAAESSEDSHNNSFYDVQEPQNFKAALKQDKAFAGTGDSDDYQISFSFAEKPQSVTGYQNHPGSQNADPDQKAELALQEGLESQAPLHVFDSFTQKRSALREQIKGNLVENTLIPPLEAFPPVAQEVYIDYQQQAKTKRKGVFGLFDTLMKNFDRQKGEEEGLARLEPRNKQKSLRPKGSFAYHSQGEGTEALYVPAETLNQKPLKVKQKPSDEDLFEIPDFLRRQAN